MSAPMPVGYPWGFGRGGASGGGVTTPPLSEGMTVNGISLNIPLPEDEPIPDAKEFNVSGSIGTAAVSAGTLITGCTLDVPPNNLGVIRGVDLYISNMLVTTNVTWTLTINGAAVSGYQGISIFARVTPFVGNGFSPKVRFRGPALVQVVFSNIDGGAYTVGAAFSGWFWPEASDERWKATGR